MAYDVFGNGKTAVKMNLGRYLEGVGVQLNYANTNPTLRIPTSTGPFGVPGVTRTWIDANADLVARLRSVQPAAPTAILRRSTVAAEQTSAARFRICVSVSRC